MSPGPVGRGPAAALTGRPAGPLVVSQSGATRRPPTPSFLMSQGDYAKIPSRTCGHDPVWGKLRARGCRGTGV